MVSSSLTVSPTFFSILKIFPAGNIFRIEKNVGDTVSDDETIIVLEAMKMETTIKTPTS